MTPRRAIFLTARREIRERLRSRAFMIGLAVQLVVVLVIVIVAALTSGGGDEFDVATVGPRGAEIGEAAQREQEGFDTTLTLTEAGDLAEARDRVADGDADAAVSASELITGADPSETLVGLLQSANRELEASRALRDAGISASQAQAALHPPPLAVTETDDGSSGKGLAFVGSIYLYIVLLTLGLTIATGVTEEKSTRVVEVILAAIRPIHLLAGKVVGIGVLGLASVLLVTVVGLGTALAITSIELPDSTADVAILVVVYFILGYLLYACAYAVAGVMVSRQEDVQSSAGPLNLLLIAGYLAGIFVGADSAAAVALSLFPPTAPMIVPARAAQDALPAGELVASLALMLAGTALLLWIAARIYDRAALRMGAPLKLRQALRLAGRGEPSG
jgi:ABC-2 type transport system permease protein